MEGVFFFLFLSFLLFNLFSPPPTNFRLLNKKKKRAFARARHSHTQARARAVQPVSHKVAAAANLYFCPVPARYYGRYITFVSTFNFNLFKKSDKVQLIHETTGDNSACSILSRE